MVKTSFDWFFSTSSAKYTLGFRVDPEDKLRAVGKEMHQLLNAHRRNSFDCFFAKKFEKKISKIF